MAKEQNFPFVHASGYTREAEAGFNVAMGAGGIVQISKILQNAGDLWVAYHQRLMAQGYSPLAATEFLLGQKWLQPAPPQPQPNFAPQAAPISPFQQQPLMTGTNGR